MKILAIHAHCPWKEGNSTHRAGQMCAAMLRAGHEVAVVWRHRPSDFGFVGVAESVWGAPVPGVLDRLSGFEVALGGTIRQIYPRAGEWMSTEEFVHSVWPDGVVSFVPVPDARAIVESARSLNIPRIYDRSDDWATMSSAWGAMASDSNERDWVGLHNGVTATTERLLAYVPGKKRLLPIYDAVCVEVATYIAQASSSVTVERPRGIIYCGSLDPRRVDWPMFARAASAVAPFPIRILGKPRSFDVPSDAAAVQLMANMPHVAFEGECPPRAVADALLGSTIGVIPFRRNRASESLLPIKALEYSAAGLSTVATNLPEVSRVPGARVVGSDEFVDALIAEIDKGSLTGLRVSPGNSVAAWHGNVTALLGQLAQLARESPAEEEIL